MGSVCVDGRVVSLLILEDGILLGQFIGDQFFCLEHLIEIDGVVHLYVEVDLLDFVVQFAIGLGMRDYQHQPSHLQDVPAYY